MQNTGFINGNGTQIHRCTCIRLHVLEGEEEYITGYININYHRVRLVAEKLSQECKHTGFKRIIILYYFSVTFWLGLTCLQFGKRHLRLKTQQNIFNGKNQTTKNYSK